MVQDAYKKKGIGDRFVIKTEIRDNRWFDGFIEFMEANRHGGSTTPAKPILGADSDGGSGYPAS